MTKKTNDYRNFGIIRTVIIIGIIIYIFGIIPQLNSEIKLFFTNPIIKIGFLALIAIIAYMDTAIAILLAIAFLVSYLQTPEHDSILYKTLRGAQAGTQSVIGGVQTGTTRLVGGVGTGAQRLIGGLGTGATQLVGKVGEGTQQLIGGVDRGTQRLIGGVGEGATGIVKGLKGGLYQVTGRESAIGKAVGGVSAGLTNLIGGVQEGAQELVSGLGGTAQNLISGIQGGLQQGVRGVTEGGQYGIIGAQTGVSKAITGLGSGAQQLIGGVQENLTSPLSGKSISQKFEDQQKYIGEEPMSDKGCNVQPYMTTGCDSIVGYNSPIDCIGIKPNDENACLCSGVKVWKDELGTQGLSSPQGFAGGQYGSTY